jgi:hypothetical protein
MKGSAASNTKMGQSTKVSGSYSMAKRRNTGRGISSIQVTFAAGNPFGNFYPFAARN